MEAVMACKSFFGNISAALFVAMAPAASHAQHVPRVEVVFVQPAKFTDVGNSYAPADRQREALLGQLKRHLEERAARHVAKDDHLAISITDVDMAGGFEPWRGPVLSDVRIVKDIYPPRIVLKFKLTRADGTVAAGQRSLSDIAFMTYINFGDRYDLLRHEKRLLDDWLEREFRQGRGKQSGRRGVAGSV
jgi:hypothetical protein